MKVLKGVRLFTAFSCFMLFLATEALSQTKPSENEKKKQTETKLFQSDSLLSITLRGNLRDLLNDRTDTPTAFPLQLSYVKDDKSETSIPVNVKTRGHFRRQRENCIYPPLLLQFPKGEAYQSSTFRDQKKLKLVMPCRQEEYVIREWLVYKIYNLITPFSFKARLVKVTLQDNRNKKPGATLYGILLEEENQMAKRNKSIALTRQLRPEHLQADLFLKTAVFQYLIGNTDWSVQFMHNIKLVAKDSLAVPVAVPYDFDHAGIVGSSYAHPAELLKIASVRQRLYRGHCLPDMNEFMPVVADFLDLQRDIYRLYEECSLLEPKYVKSTVKYLDEFYATLNDQKLWQKAFSNPCFILGGKNVVIQGLKEQ